MAYDDQNLAAQAGISGVSLGVQAGLGILDNQIKIGQQGIQIAQMAQEKQLSYAKLHLEGQKMSQDFAVQNLQMENERNLQTIRGAQQIANTKAQGDMELMVENQKFQNEMKMKQMIADDLGRASNQSIDDEDNAEEEQGRVGDAPLNSNYAKMTTTSQMTETDKEQFVKLHGEEALYAYEHSKVPALAGIAPGGFIPRTGSKLRMGDVDDVEPAMQRKMANYTAGYKTKEGHEFAVQQYTQKIANYKDAYAKLLSPFAARQAELEKSGEASTIENSARQAQNLPADQQPVVAHMFQGKMRYFKVGVGYPVGTAFYLQQQQATLEKTQPLITEATGITNLGQLANNQNLSSATRKADIEATVYTQNFMTKRGVAAVSSAYSPDDINLNKSGIADQFVNSNLSSDEKAKKGLNDFDTNNRKEILSGPLWRRTYAIANDDAKGKKTQGPILDQSIAKGTAYSATAEALDDLWNGPNGVGKMNASLFRSWLTGKKINTLPDEPDTEWNTLAGDKSESSYTALKVYASALSKLQSANSMGQGSPTKDAKDAQDAQLPGIAESFETAKTLLQKRFAVDVVAPIKNAANNINGDNTFFDKSIGVTGIAEHALGNSYGAHLLVGSDMSKQYRFTGGSQVSRGSADGRQPIKGAGNSTLTPIGYKSYIKQASKLADRTAPFGIPMFSKSAEKIIKD